VVSRPFLCPQCGGIEYEEVGPNEIRCVECGQASRYSTMTLTARPPGPEHDDVIARMRERQNRDAVHTFRDMPAAPYGLDGRWNGHRFLGGSSRSYERVTAIVLAYTDKPWDPSAPKVRVETRWGEGSLGDRRLDFEQGMLARQQVGEYWQATGVRDDAVRRAAFPVDDSTFDPPDPTGPWATASIAVDGRPVDFRMLGDDDYWVAQARCGDAIVGIESTKWPVAATGLVTIASSTPYEEGSRTMPFPPPQPPPAQPPPREPPA
jgi:hypothetical protein